jgi:hypothetical protein
MADPLSILGAAAAASQLVEQGAQVIKFACKIYSRFQSPEKTQKQLAQVVQVKRCILSVVLVLTVPDFVVACGSCHSH